MSAPYTNMRRPGFTVTDDDIAGLMMALARGQGDFSEAEAERLVRWAHEQRTGATIVDMLIAGALTVSMREGDEPVFDLAERAS